MQTFAVSLNAVLVDKKPSDHTKSTCYGNSRKLGHLLCFSIHKE